MQCGKMGLGLKTSNVFSLFQDKCQYFPVVINRKDFQTNFLLSAAYEKNGDLLTRNLLRCPPSLNGQYLMIPIDREFNGNQSRFVYNAINLHDPSKNEKTLLYSPWISITHIGIVCYLTEQLSLAATSSNQGSLSLYTHMDGAEIGRNTSGVMSTIQDNYVVMCKLLFCTRCTVYCLKTGNLIFSLPPELEVKSVLDVQIAGHRIAVRFARSLPNGYGGTPVSVFDIKSSKQLLCSESDLNLFHIAAYKLENRRIILYSDERVHNVNFGIV